jgi:hypothetical protein
MEKSTMDGGMTAFQAYPFQSTVVFPSDPFLCQPAQRAYRSTVVSVLLFTWQKG